MKTVSEITADGFKVLSHSEDKKGNVTAFIGRIRKLNRKVHVFWCRKTKQYLCEDIHK